MTQLLPAQAALEAAPAEGRRRRLPSAATLAVALALAVWAWPVTHAAGGRDPWAVPLGLVSLLPALLLCRPWRQLPGWEVGVALAPSLAAAVVCLTAPTGWDGLDETSTLAYAGGGYLVLRAWAGSPRRRTGVLVVLAVVAMEQFSQAYLPWWGGESVARLMVGTFYWHNQFAAFMLAGAVVSIVLATRAPGVERSVGWAVAPWCVAALFFAGSRSTLALFVLLWLVLLGFALRDRRGRLGLLVVVGLSVGLATLLASPLLMADGGDASSTMRAREGQESAAGNGMARLHYWQAALRLWQLRPVTGTGFDSFGGASAPYLPTGTTGTIYAHNGYLQALAEGGLVLLLPLVVATGLAVLLALRVLVSRSARTGPDGLVAVAAPVSLVGLTLHSGVDFDWAYPSLVFLFAVLAAVLPRRTAARPAGRGPRRALVAAVAVLGVVLLAVPAATRASGLRAGTQEPPAWLTPVAAVVPTSGRVGWLPAASLCARDLTAADPVAVRSALRCTAAPAADNPSLQLRRAAALVRTGRVDDGLALGAAVVHAYGDRLPMLRLSWAEVLAAAGRRAEARAELTALRSEVVGTGDVTDLRDVDRALSRLETTGQVR